MKFLHDAGILEKDVVDQLVRLARLRNPLMHKYWEINDERIIREARESGLKTIRRALDGISRFIER